MKKKYYFWLLVALSVVILGSCVKELIDEHNNSDVSDFLTVSEAQEFFESSMTKIATRNIGKNPEQSKIHPGEFTPQWDKPTFYQQSARVSIESPILSSSRLMAIQAKFENGVSKAYPVPILQKLFVVKNKKTENMGQYIMMYIPLSEESNNKEYCRVGFSGIILYCDVESGIPIVVSQYINGAIKRTVNMLSNQLTKEQKVERFKILTKNILFAKQNGVSTRSGEDDWWDNDPDYIEDLDEVTVYPEDDWDDWEWPEDDYDDGWGDEEPYEDEEDSGSSVDIAPKAKKIFRNSNMTTKNWKLIERMIKKILENCMGSNLFAALKANLNGKTFAIQFDFGAQSSYFDSNGGGITMNNTTSNTLLHEMFHAYQAYQETVPSLVGATANLEVEAGIAQYMYLSSVSEATPDSEWIQRYERNKYGRAVANLSEHLDSKGNIVNISIAQFESIFIVAIAEAARVRTDYKIDYDRNLSQNLKNLRELTKGCL